MPYNRMSLFVSFSTICHFICAVAPERHAEHLGPFKVEKEGEKEGERKKQGLLSPEGSKQDRGTEGLYFLFLNGDREKK